MWNKDQNAPAPSPQTPSIPASRPVPADITSVGTGALIGETMRIKGDIFTQDEIRVDGEVEGKMESHNRLTVGPTGKADASIKAVEVIIAGTVKGNVEAGQRIVLRKGANLVGDVKTAGIVIEDGAYFRGGIDIARPETTTAQAAGR
jgi:cytoskeletal protein CcmA (bactofilin family)